MNEQIDFSSKPEAAIQVRVYGIDVHEQRFDEVSTAFPTSKGVMLETVHAVREGTPLEITHLLTNRKAAAQVKSLGPKLGESTLVFVEGGDVEKFWVKTFVKEPDRKPADAPGKYTASAVAADAGTLLAVPERALMHVSKPLLPTMDRFMETLNALVESALDANLRPAVEQIANKIPEHVAKAQTNAFANLEEQIEAARKQVEGVISDGTAKVRNAMQETSAGLQKELKEACQSLSQETQNELSGNSEKLVAEFAQRLSAKVTTVFGDTAIALSVRAQEVEKEFDGRLAEMAEDAAKRFHAGLEKSFEESLPGYAERLQEQFASSADRFRKTFLEKLENDLNARQENLARQADFLMKDLADQNRSGIARMLRDLAGEMDNQAEIVPHTADAAD